MYRQCKVKNIQNFLNPKIPICVQSNSVVILIPNDLSVLHQIGTEPYPLSLLTVLFVCNMSDYYPCCAVSSLLQCCVVYHHLCAALFSALVTLCVYAQCMTSHKKHNWHDYLCDNMVLST
jgi:hypothetical protein